MTLDTSAILFAALAGLCGYLLGKQAGASTYAAQLMDMVTRVQAGTPDRYVAWKKAEVAAVTPEPPPPPKAPWEEDAYYHDKVAIQGDTVFVVDDEMGTVKTWPLKDWATLWASSRPSTLTPKSL